MKTSNLITVLSLLFAASAPMANADTVSKSELLSLFPVGLSQGFGTDKKLTEANEENFWMLSKSETSVCNFEVEENGGHILLKIDFNGAESYAIFLVDEESTIEREELANGTTVYTENNAYYEKGKRIPYASPRATLWVKDNSVAIISDWAYSAEVAICNIR